VTGQARPDPFFIDAADAQPDAAIVVAGIDGPASVLDTSPGTDGVIERHAIDALLADTSDTRADTHAGGSLGDARISVPDVAIH
jgi:hypothetical protein